MERPITVLIVEDDRDLLHVIGGALYEEGCLVVLAHSGEAALREMRLAREVPQVAFIDWCMPQMDGVETAYRLRDLPGFHALPIYIMTGMTKLPRALDDFAVLYKPFALTQLCEIVAKVLAPIQSAMGV